MAGITHQCQLLLQFSCVRDPVNILDLLVRFMNLPGNSQVTGNDGQCRQDRAQEEHAQDEWKAIGGVVELAPGYCTRDAKWLRAVVTPAYQGQNGPEQGVEPDESNQDANSVLGDFVTCKKGEEQAYNGSHLSHTVFAITSLTEGWWLQICLGCWGSLLTFGLLEKHNRECPWIGWDLSAALSTDLKFRKSGSFRRSSWPQMYHASSPGMPGEYSFLSNSSVSACI